MSSDQSNTGTQHIVHGGCLCEAIRYTITFPPDHDFSWMGTTCQCEQCRKNTGSLLGRFQGVPTTSFALSSSSTTTTSSSDDPPSSSPSPPPQLKRYYASPGTARTFCSDCGSFLYWRKEERGGPLTYVAVGTLDKASLASETGRLMADAGRHFWCADEVPGVTDHLKGERWRYDCVGEGAVLME